MEEERNERYCLERLRWLRDEFSDEIPEEILSGVSPQKNFKVRRNWWQGVVGTLANALERGKITNPEVQEEVKGFLEHYTSEKFHEQPLTTAEDIKRANEIIDLVLGEKT